MGSSSLGTVSRTSGGVGRNIAACVAAISKVTKGTPPSLFTCVGDDSLGTALKQECGEIGIESDLVFSVPGVTSSFVALLDARGDLVAAIADMAVLKQLTPSVIDENLQQLVRASLVVVDANLETDTLLHVCKTCALESIPTFFESVSVAKVTRAIPLLRYLTYLKSNLDELRKLHGALGMSPKPTADSVDTVVEMAIEVVHEMVNSREKTDPLRINSVPAHVIVTRGSETAVYVHGYLDNSTQAFQSHVSMIEPEFVPVDEISNTTGAGDTFVGALCWGLAHNYDVERVLSGATYLSAQALRSHEAVPVKYVQEYIRKVNS